MAETQPDAADTTEQNKDEQPEQEQPKDAPEQAPAENEQAEPPKDEVAKDEVVKDDDQKEPEKDKTEQEEPKDADKPADKDEKTSEKQDEKAVEAEEEKEEKKEPSEFQLYYWKGMGGRGTLARLCMAVCGAEWDEQSQDDTKDVKGANIKGFPNFAMPILKHKENIISQTPAICIYIMEKYGFVPADPLDKVYALQVLLTAHDASGEWSAKLNKYVGFDGWITKRIGGFLSVLEEQLKRNNEGKGWFFGDKPCVADVFVADFMRRYKFCKSDHYKSNKLDFLKAHCQRFEELERVKKYLESDEYKKVRGQKSEWWTL